MRILPTAILLGVFCASIRTTLGDGVTVGNSSLFDTVDYSDTFTGTDDGGAPNRPYIPAIQPPAAYVVENTHGNAPQSFQIGSGFSFAGDRDPASQGFVQGGSAFYPTILGANASNAGSDTGFTQTGGAVDYGLLSTGREEYWVQVDAIQNPDRVDISSGAALGIFSPNSLSVFFRGNGSGNASLFDGATDTPIQNEIPGFDTGITGPGQWHNYAVRYDLVDKEIEIYVDEMSKGIIDLTTFAGGLYQNWSNKMVGAGGAGGDRTWTDNFQTGGNGPAPPPKLPLPDPGDLPGLPDHLFGFWDFNEAAMVDPDFLIDFAYDRKADRNGTFQGTVTRVPGLIGLGAAMFNDTNGDSVNVGTEGFSFTDGIAVEAVVTTDWDGNDQAEFFRKEDGGNRILLSFQAPGNINNAFNQLVGTGGTSGISLGLNVNGAYQELDIAFDGLDGRPTLAEVADGNPHHFVGTLDATTGEKAVYMDGQLLGMVDVGDNVNLTTGGGAPALIGASGGGEPFDGVIDELAIYSGPLTPADVAVHYANVQAGTNYFGAADLDIRITEFFFTPSASTIELTWKSLPGREYTVEATQTLSAWADLVDGISSGGTETESGAIDLSPFFPVLPADLQIRVRDTTPDP